MQGCVCFPVQPPLNVKHLMAVMGVKDEELQLLTSTVGQEDLLEPLDPNLVIHPYILLLGPNGSFVSILYSE